MNKTEYWAKCLKILKKEFMARGIMRCELCGKDTFLSFHHRRKRRFYKPLDAALHDFNEVLLVCVSPCHESLEYNKKLTEDTFKRLRG